jgi:hypothetical protein
MKNGGGWRGSFQQYHATIIFNLVWGYILLLVVFLGFNIDMVGFDYLGGYP